MKKIILITCFFMLFGCAKVEVRKITNSFGSSGKVIKPDDTGIRFYRPAPHIWILNAPLSEKINTVVSEQKDTNNPKLEKTTTATVSSITSPGYTAQIVMLPDFSNEYIIQWSAGIGSVNPNFTLQEGWNLNNFNSTIESKFSENVTAMSGAVTSVGKLFMGAITKSPRFEGAGLYKLNVSPAGKYSLGDIVLSLEE